jgi:endogenous inhibitor of DNA gyrase (YacG/DUF329 family)
MSNRNFHERAGKGCPLCGQPFSAAHKPFCSQGCRDRDLLRWLGEGYRVAGQPADAGGQEIDVDGLDSEA